MVNIRITFPVLTQSLTKSIDQRSFGLVAAGASHYAIPADPPSLSNPHRQTFLAVQPIHPLVIGRHPFAQQHRRQSPIAKPHAPGRQLFQASS
jgi:hypothetical protein